MHLPVDLCAWHKTCTVAERHIFLFFENRQLEYPMNQNPDLGSNFETPASTNPSTTRKVADAAHKAIDQSADRAEDVERRLREKAGRAQERVGASQKAAGAQLERSLDQLEMFVRERPLTATGIAFAAGIVAAAILRR
jgi:ElaB/YqjD/DUF883 family membrane-anchored ribosome-binding protein